MGGGGVKNLPFLGVSTLWVTQCIVGCMLVMPRKLNENEKLNYRKQKFLHVYTFRNKVRETTDCKLNNISSLLFRARYTPVHICHIFSSAVIILWVQPSFSSIFSPIHFLKAITLCYLNCVCCAVVVLLCCSHVFAVGNKSGMIARV